MLPEDVEHYMQELSRVLKGGGRSLITFFLINDQSKKLMSQKKSAIDFPDECGVYRAFNKRVHENAVAYEESYVRGLYDKNGLQMVEPIYYGSWCGRANFLSYQDIIMASKK
jgi:ubiquinone/menaquinone biosynthesis C-methylase UbiE